jgi:hypothetical protein
MALTPGMHRAAAINKWIGDHLIDLRGPSTNRHRAAGASFMACFAHVYSVRRLVEEEVGLGSAFALVRVVWETYVNGAYLWSVAGEDLIDQFCAGKRDLPKLGKMVKALRNNEVYAIGTLSRIHEQAEGPLNSYTHGGSLAIQRWNKTPGEIGPDFAPEEVDEVLDFCSRIAIFATIGMAMVTENEPLAEAVHGFFKQQAHLYTD